MDVPVEVFPGVLIGSLRSIDSKLLDDANIGAVINLSGRTYETHLPTLNIIMDDTDVSPRDLDIYIKKFALGVAAIEAADGKRVLVHCAAGINRAATLIGFYLLERDFTYDQMITLLQIANKKRGVDLLTNPSFRSLLHTHYILRKNFSNRRDEFHKL